MNKIQSDSIISVIPKAQKNDTQIPNSSSLLSTLKFPLIIIISLAILAAVLSIILPLAIKGNKKTLH